MDLTPEEFREVATIFAKACKMLEDERAEYLDKTCYDNTELRAQVQRLLDDDASPAFKFDAPEIARVALAEGSAIFDNAAAPTNLPQRIGGYEIVGVLGEGGMGIVYEAKQERPARSVALKVLRPGMLSRSARVRLKQEAEILGQLQHPGIASIYEAGMADDVSPEGRTTQRPFLAMELIRGRPLGEFVTENELPIRERLTILAKICDAVEHAHQMGIIHRDLKPGNILVDTGGTPKVLDFGVARMTDADVRVTTLQTGIGQLIGTIAYMSPEQVIAKPDDLDTRSDVYALGVIGYELLAGALPQDLTGVAIPEAVRLIRDSDPTPLSSVNKVFRGDLNVIFVKALEKDRRRRYATAAALADDVRRYLRNEPITARRPSATYQFRKLTSRHKALTSSLTVTFVVLIVFGIWMSMLYRHADRQMVRAQLSQRFLEKMLSSIDPGVAMGKDTSIIQGVLAEAAEQVGEELAGQPEAEADIRATIGTSYLSVGIAEAAKAQLEIALKLRKVHRGVTHSSVAEVTRLLAECAGKEGLRTEAEELAREAVALFREHNPDLLQTADALQTLGWIISELAGHHAEAVDLFHESLEIAERHGGREQPIYAVGTERLAIALWRWQKLGQAEQIARETLALKRKIYGTDHPSVATAMVLLGQILTSQKRFADAEPHIRESLDMHRRLYGEDHPVYATALNSLAQLYAMQGDHKSAEPLARECLDLVTRLRGESSHETAFAWMNLANIVDRKGDYAEAERLYRISNGRFRDIFPPEHPYVRSPHMRLAEMMERYGHYDKAETIWRQMVEETRELFPEGHTLRDQAIRARQRLGRCIVHLQKCDEAEELLVSCYEELRSQENPKQSSFAKAAKDLVFLYESCSNEERAATYRAIAESASQD